MTKGRGRLRMLVGLGLAIWLVLPLVPLAIWSFAKGWFYPDLLPKVWTLSAWNYAISDTSGVLSAFWMTIWIALLSSFLAILIGVPAGRALGQHEFQGKGLVELLVLAPVIVPGIAVVLGLHSVFISLGLTNTIAGVVLVHLIPTVPYMTLIMAGVFANHNPAFEDQARSLGASKAVAFWQVTLPAIMPGIIVGGLFSFLISSSQYILTLVIGGGRVATLPLLLFSFVTSGRNDIAGAIAVIYVLPGVIIIAFTAKYLAGRNISLSSVGPK